MPYKPDLYKGESLRKRKYEADPYLPSEEMIRAVNVACHLRRPLLVRGEPGCGKTRLAEAIAVEWHKQNWKKNLKKWPIRSTTKVQEGFYSFDHVARLRDSQIEEERNKPIQDYVRLGPLGEAIRYSKREPYKPPVVLIDEIDKADIDLPNDLLDLLEYYSFKIEETGEEHVAKQSPLIIITSNDEKELSNAFLRRCVFLWINFPKEEKLVDIAKAFFPMEDSDEDWQKCLPDLVSKFLNIRKSMMGKRSIKLPSTSEMLDWLRSLDRYTLDAEGEREMKKVENILKKDSREVVFPETLFKTKEDYFAGSQFIQ